MANSRQPHQLLEKLPANFDRYTATNKTKNFFKSRISYCLDLAFGLYLRKISELIDFNEVEDVVLIWITSDCPAA